MKHFDDVVQKTGFIKHELISIDVPEETDIKQIIQHSLKPIRDELKQINESMECLREEIMNTKSDIRKSEEDIQILKKNIADSAQQHRFLSAELKQQLESVIEVEQPEERVLLQTLVHGSYVNAPLDDQHKEIQLMQRNITVMKQRIVDKDKVISGQFKNQHVDSRRELEQLKQTRQKIGYYNSAVVNRATGQSLNKNL